MDLLNYFQSNPKDSLEALNKLFSFTSLRRNKVVNIPPLSFTSEGVHILSVLIDRRLNEEIGFSILDYGLSHQQIVLYSTVLESLFNQVVETMPDEDFQASADVIEDVPMPSNEPRKAKPDIDYIVLTASSPVELSQKVTNYLKSGYTLGNLSLCDTYLAQVVTRGI